MTYSYEEYALIFKALSDNTRLKIFCLLNQGEETCACHLLDEVNITQPTLSYHMKILVEAGLALARKDGQWMKYSINKDRLELLAEFLKEIGEAK